MTIKICLLYLVLCMSITSPLVQAEEVTLPYKGLTLNADLALAAGKKAADGVILITHGTLAHRDMETIASLRGLLKDKGYNTLVLNLSLGQSSTRHV